jgi:S-adenosylmethionine:tRNA ribosyltransferase-isomerase
MSELDAYDYELPAERIAQQPLAQREDARLMVVDRGAQEIRHAQIRDLPEMLSSADVLVLNNTRVVPARLVGTRTKTGGRWEGLFLEADESGNWRILAKSRGKPEAGETVTLHDLGGAASTELMLVTREAEGMWIVRPRSQEPAFALLERVGRVPLPHYIRGGEMTDADRARYQSVFAQVPGSAAAPTASLHFSERLLSRLLEQGIAQAPVTLHVGLDTFRPIKVERLDEHRMHREWCEVPAATVATIGERKARGGRVIAVGTTSMRALESAAHGGALAPWNGATDLFIRPGFEFRVVDALLTNFHLPRSTLLVLLRTFGGDALIRRAYEEAIAEEYRFFSYGDAMLVL